MRRFGVVVLFPVIMVCCLFAQQPVSQKTYSESGAYTPREISKKDKNKNDKKTLAVPVVADPRPKQIRVSVLDTNGKTISGLTKDDFKLFVDDQITEISSVETGLEPLNYILLIDTSASSIAAIRDLANRVDRVIEQFSGSERAMAISFTRKLKVICELTDDREKLRKAIQRATAVVSESGTSLYDHIQHAATNITPLLPAPSAVILFSDGVDTTSRKSGFESSLLSVENGNSAFFVSYLDTLPPFPIGVTSQQVGSTKEEYSRGRAYLNDLMKLSGGHAVRDVTETGSSAMLSTELPASIRSQYVLTFTPRPGSTVGQRHTLNVRVNRPNLAVIARGSYIDK